MATTGDDMHDSETAPLGEREPLVIRVSSSNLGSRFTLALLTGIVIALSFIAMHESKLWVAVAFFVLPALHLASIVFFPHDLTLQVDRETVDWKLGRREQQRVRAQDVSAVHITWKTSEQSLLELSDGGYIHLPDTVLMEASVDPEQLCEAWSRLWPGKRILLIKYPGSEVQLFLASDET